MLAVVTNIDADHMETYGHDFGKLKRAFVDFLQRLPFYGVAVLCIDDANVREILPAITKPIVTYGLADGRAAARDRRRQRRRPHALRRARAAARPTSPVELNLAGVHNVRNALAAIAVGREVGVADAAIATALAEFRGVAAASSATATSRSTAAARFTLIDDYGHHPVEMAATLAAARGELSRAGGSCSRSSRIATRARATCSRTSCACCRRSTRWC